MKPIFERKCIQDVAYSDSPMSSNVLEAGSTYTTSPLWEDGTVTVYTKQHWLVVDADVFEEVQP